MINKKAKSKVRITERDLRCATWIAEQQAVRLDTVRQLLEIWHCPVDARALRRLAQRWEIAGLIHRERLLANAPSILWPTVESMRLAEMPLNRGEKAPKPSLSLIQHTLAVSRVRLEYEKNGASWLCERKLRATTGGHLADARATYQGVPILVEIDRTRKVKARLAIIMASNARTHKDTLVDYWTTESLAPFIESQRNTLDESLRDRVRVFLLPEDVR